MATTISPPPLSSFLVINQDFQQLLQYVTISNTFLVILGYLLLEALYNLFFHPLRNVPGPFLAKLGQSWRNHKYFRSTWHDDCLEMHKTYGNVVRIAPNELSFVDEVGLKSLYGHGRQVLKSSWYDTWTVPNMTISFFAATDVKVHRHLRSRVSAVYSMTSILSMEPLVQDVLDLNLRQLQGFADRGEVVRIDQWANYFTFDIVGHLAMGGTIGFLEQGRDVDGIIRSIHDGFWIMANMGNIPLQTFWFNNPISKWLVKNFGGERLNAFDVFLEWLERRVDERMRNGLGDARRDMLQHFIDAKDPSGQPVKKGDVMIEGVNILGAGADTTAIGLLANLGNVIANPGVQKKLQDELDQAYIDWGLHKEGREFTFKEIEKLPYLSAVITESTRIHPSIQYQLPRYVPDEGVQLGSHFVKKGAICGISPRSMNRSKEIFGPDADVFRPERWLPQFSGDEERIKQQSLLLSTFGMGSRGCVGRNLATVEMYKYIAQFFRNFDAEFVRPDRPWETKSQWFSFQRDFNVRLARRHVLN
ncbi:cytochrome P450 [Xylaria digitata]|nr:cytochrome P450 [Xylaria digitata]